MASTVRCCTVCGEPQHLERKTVDYPQSGLDNVELNNVPVWVCRNGHNEVLIPAMTALHELLAQAIIRKPALLNGAEIRFLRRRVDLSSKDFAARLGISAVHLSRLEHESKRRSKSLDLLVRLVSAALIAQRDGKSFPADLGPFIDQLEKVWDIGRHRLKHLDQALPEQEEWVREVDS